MERTLVVMVEWGLHRRLPCFGHGLRSSRCDLPAPQATQGQVPVLASLEDSEHDNTRRPLADSRIRRACGLGSSRRLHDPTRAAVQNKRSFIYDDYEHDDARGAAEWVLADASSLRHGTGRRRRWRSTGSVAVQGLLRAMFFGIGCRKPCHGCLYLRRVVFRKHVCHLGRRQVRFDPGQIVESHRAAADRSYLQTERLQRPILGCSTISEIGHGPGNNRPVH